MRKIKEVIRNIIRFIMGYKIDYYGMCPDCSEKNIKNITFCSHPTAYYKKKIKLLE